jgi:hypothetical protein
MRCGATADATVHHAPVAADAPSSYTARGNFDPLAGPVTAGSPDTYLQRAAEVGTASARPWLSPPQPRAGVSGAPRESAQ